MTRRLAITVACTLLLSGRAAAQHSGGATARPSPTAPREASQFAFLIGQWDLKVMPKVNSVAARIHGSPKLLGTWKAWRMVDGFGIEDELRIVDGSGNPSALSHSLRLYSVADAKWLITGVDAYRGRVSSSAGSWSGAQMIINGTGTDAEGKSFLTRTRFYEITAKSFKYQQDRSSDNGSTWDEGAVRIEAKRTSASAAR